jgi:hypothetical protein
VVGFGGGVQLIQRIHGRVDRGIESKGAFGTANIIIDGLGHTDHRDPFFIEFLGNAQRAIPADHDQPIQFHLANILDQLAGNILDDLLAVPDHLAGKRISAVCRAKDRPTTRQDPAHIVRVERLDAILLHESVKTVFYPQDLDIIIMPFSPLPG